MTYRRSILVMAFALILAPSAMAQLPGVNLVPVTIQGTVASPAAPVAMDSTVRIPYRIEYAVGGPHADMLVDLIVFEAPPGWDAVAEPAQHALPAALGETYVLEGAIALRHDGTPVAFRHDVIVLDVNAPGDGYAVMPATAQIAFEAAADWRPGLYAVLPAPRLLLDERGGADVVNAEIMNTGNGFVRVRAEKLRAPTGCDATLNDAPATMGPGQRAVLSIALACERRWSAGSVTVRLEHALAGDEARTGEPVEPQWDIVPVDWDEVQGGGFGFNLGTASAGGSRAYGDEPISSKNEASWGATLLVPMALLVAALVARRR